MSPLSQLRDIHGLDPISWWPLAPGWWFVGVLAVAALTLIAMLVAHWRQPFGSWQRDAAAKLGRLQRRLKQQSAKQSAVELSELLRRIAMARQGRESCAGLSGRDWLRWLRQQDPKGFDWEAQGGLLISLPYGPETDPAGARAQLRVLARAAEQWTRSQRKGRGHV